MYYVKMEVWFDYQFLIYNPDDNSYGYDDHDGKYSKAEFKTLDEAVKWCEESDEIVVDENGEIVHQGIVCCDCHGDWIYQFPGEDELDDCETCNNTGTVEVNNEG